MSRDDEYLRDMLRAAQRAMESVGGWSEDVFLRNEDLQDIVIRKLTVLGEAARRVAAPRQATMPQVPWREIIATRNALTHDYDGVNLIEVWHTVQHDLPQLVSVLDPIAGIHVRPDLWEGF